MIRTSRFAPSPTGRLHLGHAWSAVQVHALARASNGRFLLRIEDIDQGRSRPEHVEGILADLAWLGIEHDGPVLFQSQRLPIYAEALDRLKAQELVYPCFCTRADIAREVAASASAPHGSDGPVYPGTCRELAPDVRARRLAVEPHAWRIDMARAVAVAGPLEWRDAHAGVVRADPQGQGDVVLARKDLNTAQAAMLAGLVKAPSRLAPTGNLKGARERQAVVVSTMKAAGFLTPAEARAVKPAKLRVAKGDDLPSGTYFADWVIPAARDRAGGVGTDLRVTTTLESRIQRAAERAVRRAGLRQTQVALVAMHPDGRVIAMIGGKNYKDSPFNRAVQARRQPGSTFKLFVYLAALRSGLSPDSPVQDEPLTIGDWSPKNSDGRYLGTIPLTRAFARSSNVASARLTQEVGVRNVIRAARDLGISTPIPNEATIALGTANVSLLELTAAYAAIAAGEAPVRPHGLKDEEQTSWFERLRNSSRPLGRRELDGMRELLAASIRGTGHQANLPIEAFGKTGTTQDSRDALFVGYAGDIVAGVWLGNDDNTPNPGLAGGGLPARIWRDFMTEALGVQLPPPPPEVNEDLDEAIDNSVDIAGDAIDEAGARIDEATDALEGQVQGLGLNLRLDRDGGIVVDRNGPDRRGPPPPREPDARRLPEDEE